MADKATTNKEWVIDLDKIKAKEQKALNEAITKSRETSEDDLMYEWWARVFISWPFDLDPSSPESYPELGLKQLQQVAFRFFRELIPAEPPTTV